MKNHLLDVLPLNHYLIYSGGGIVSHPSTIAARL